MHTSNCGCDACMELRARQDTVNGANLSRIQVERFWIVLAIALIDGERTRPIRELTATNRHTSYASAYNEMLRLTRTVGGVFGIFELHSVARSYMSAGIGTVVDTMPF